MSISFLIDLWNLTWQAGRRKQNALVPFETRAAISKEASHPYIYVSNRESSVLHQALKSRVRSLQREAWS